MKKLTKVIIVFLAIVLVFVAGYFILIKDSDAPIEFTSEKWNEHIWQRDRMIDSLNSKYDLKSMNKKQVISLLGHNGILDNTGEYCVEYYIEKGYVDPLLLSFQFDNEGNVLSFGIRTG